MCFGFVIYGYLPQDYGYDLSQDYLDCGRSSACGLCCTICVTCLIGLHCTICVACWVNAEVI